MAIGVEAWEGSTSEQGGRIAAEVTQEQLENAALGLQVIGAALGVALPPSDGPAYTPEFGAVVSQAYSEYYSLFISPVILNNYVVANTTEAERRPWEEGSALRDAWIEENITPEKLGAWLGANPGKSPEDFLIASTTQEQRANWDAGFSDWQTVHVTQDKVGAWAQEHPLTDEENAFVLQNIISDMRDRIFGVASSVGLDPESLQRAGIAVQTVNGEPVISDQDLAELVVNFGPYHEISQRAYEQVTAAAAPAAPVEQVAAVDPAATGVASDAASAAVGATRTEMVWPEQDPEITERVMRVETALAQISAAAKDANLPAPGAVDGRFDEASFATYEAALAFLKEQTKLAGDYPDAAYSPEFGAALEGRLPAMLNVQAMISSAEEAEKLRAAAASVPGLVADLNYLHAANALVAVAQVEQQVQVAQAPAATVVPGASSQPDAATPPVDVAATPSGDTADAAAGAASAEAPAAAAEEAPVAQGDSSTDIKAASFVVEQVLYGLNDVIGQSSQFGMLADVVGSVVTPLTEAEAADMVFDEKSQDLTAKAIMALRMLNGEENPDGSYNSTVRDTLKMAILTKPEFQMIRDKLGIETYSPEQAQALLQPFALDEPVKPADSAEEAEKVAYFTEKREFDRRKDLFDKEQAKIAKLNVLFESLDTLQRNNMLLDAQRAKETNKFNLMMDAASTMLDKWSPGMKAMIQDFFTNNQFGQMFGSILAMFGINVGRIWGEKDDTSVLERAKPVVEDKFNDLYAKAQEDLGDGATHQQVMAKLTENVNGRLDGWLTEKAIKLIFKDEDEGKVKEAIALALSEASATGNQADAQSVFVGTLIEAGKQFQAGQDLSVEAIRAELAEMESEVQGLVREYPELGPDGDPALQNLEQRGGLRAPDGTPVSFAGGPLAPAAVLADAAPAPAPAAGAEIESAPLAAPGEAAVTEEPALRYDRDPKDYDVTVRYPKGRVAAIGEVMFNNFDALGLDTLDKKLLREGSGYDDRMTRAFNGLVEELYVRAQIQTHLDGGGTFSTLDVDGIDHSFNGQEDLDTVLSYMRARGVGEEQISKFAENVMSLDKDMQSPALNGGGNQRLSVWDHSALRDQISVEVTRRIVEQMQRESAPAPAPVVPTLEGNLAPTVLTLTATLDAAQDLRPFKQPTEQCRPMPETFSELRALNEDQAKLIADHFAKNRLIRDQARDGFGTTAPTSRQIMDLVMNRAQLGKKNQIFAILEPSKFGVTIPGVDVIVATPDRDGGYDYRYVNYGEDGIRPLSEHNEHDFNEPYVPGHTRLDDLLDEAHRSPGGRIQQSANFGYTNIMAITNTNNPDDPIRPMSALAAVYYNLRITQDHQNAYVSGYAERRVARQDAEAEAIARHPSQGAYAVDEACRVISGPFRVASEPATEWRHPYTITQGLHEALGIPNGGHAGPLTALTAQIDQIGEMLGLQRGYDPGFDGKNWPQTGPQGLVEQNARDMGLEGDGSMPPAYSHDRRGPVTSSPSYGDRGN